MPTSIGVTPLSELPRPPMFSAHPDLHEVDTILSHRDTPVGREYLIHWSNTSASEDSWEPFSNLSRAPRAIGVYLASLAPRTVPSGRGGNVTRGTCTGASVKRTGGSDMQQPRAAANVGSKGAEVCRTWGTHVRRTKHSADDLRGLPSYLYDALKTGGDHLSLLLLTRSPYFARLPYSARLPCSRGSSIPRGSPVRAALLFRAAPLFARLFYSARLPCSRGSSIPRGSPVRAALLFRAAPLFARLFYSARLPSSHCGSSSPPPHSMADASADPLPPVPPSPPVAPVCAPLTTLDQLLQWRPGSPATGGIYNRATAPFRARSAPGAARGELPRRRRQRVLACHDMMGGYVEDERAQGSACSEVYRAWEWDAVDVWVYFSHHLVTLPPVAWSNCCRTHGVQVRVGVGMRVGATGQ
ncbi:unnamed protein product, partial [Closterium sp. Naga37s-1]